MHVAVRAQKGSQTCDKDVVTAVCQTLRSTGITVPGCPANVTEVTVKKEQINVIVHCLNFVVTISWAKSM